MDADELVFVDEVPPPRRGSVSWYRRLAPLRENPGRWAAINEYRTRGSAATMLWQFQSGRVSNVSPDDYVFERRDTVLYAVYKGS